MKFGKALVVVLAGLGCAGAARGQAAAYVGYSATEMSGIACLSAASIPCSSGGGKVNPSGFVLGGYYDFRSVGPVRLGVDLRYMDGRSNKSAVDSGGGKDQTTSNTILVGLRGSIHTRFSWLRPYAQVSFGRTGTDATEPSCQTSGGGILLCSGTVGSASPRQVDSFLQYEGFAGADIRVLPVVDIRAIELGVGNMNRFGSGTAGTTSSVGLKSIGFGIVFHMPSS